MRLKFAYAVLLASLFFACSSDDDNGATPIEFNNELDRLVTLGGSGEDDALSVIETSDGQIALLGYTQSNDGDVEGKLSNDSDYWLIKLDLELNIIWQKTFGGSSDDRGQSLVGTADGGFLVTGFSRSTDGDVSSNSGFHDFWVLKLSATGDIIWEKSIGFSGNDRSFSVIETIDGGYFVTGFLDVTASGGEGNDNGETKSVSRIPFKHGVGEFWGVKLNRFGQTEWRRYFGGSNNDRSYDVAETSDGNLLMIGSSESDDFDITSPKGSYDFWAVKLGLDGDLIWQKNFGGSNIDIAYSIARTPEDQFIIAGDTRSDDGDVSGFKGNTDFWVVKFDDSSNMLWQNAYGGSDFESARDIISLGNSQYLVCGSSKSNDSDLSFNYGQNDIWTIRINEDGTLIDETSIGGTGLDFAQAAVKLRNGTVVVVVGSSESNDNQILENKGGKDALIIILK